jgi:uncharacterized protein
LSYVIDANLLIYAVNQDTEFHAKAIRFIEERSESSETWIFPWPVATAFIRIVTHPGILPYPLAPDQAIETLHQLFKLPQVILTGEDGKEIWDLFSKEVSTHHCRGNGVTDTLIVSIMRLNGVTTIYTKDRDFLRFQGIKAVDPLK